MESTISLPVSEGQVIALARQLTPQSKQMLLQNLIPEMGSLDELMAYGDLRIRAICARRGIDWDSLLEGERMQLLDELLHEKTYG